MCTNFKKAIHGLQQAPHAWFHRFSSFLLSYAFFCSHANASMFIARTESHILVLLLYVDNIVLASNSDAMLYHFIILLSEQFAMKDLRDLEYFLGIQVVRPPSGLCLTQ